MLDLFAGTGALGIEAVSLGAAFTLFVDDGAEARALLRENVAAFGLGGVTRVFRRDATKLGPAYPLEPFSLVLLDPPYGQNLRRKGARLGAPGAGLSPEALIVVEEATKARFAAPEGFTELERRATTTREFILLRSNSGVMPASWTTLAQRADLFGQEFGEITAACGAPARTISRPRSSSALAHHRIVEACRSSPC